MRIYDIQCNHLNNPLGFRMERACFSWKTADVRGAAQESARVQVAADREMKAILLDTGFDREADSLCYEVSLDLKPRTRYYYTVSVRTDAGEEGTSDVHWFETGKREEPWQAMWITCDSAQKRHPWFEKEISLKKPVSRARLYICGLGLYEAYYTKQGQLPITECGVKDALSAGNEGIVSDTYFNGTRIGEEYLTPYSNDYNQWVQYQTYDVTEQIQEAGKLSVLLGNGWYKGRFGFSAREEKGFYGNEWLLLAELRLLYADGTEEVIGTDDTWTVRRSRLTFSSLYDGEHRDDTLPELPAEKAVLCHGPKGRLTERMSTPVTVHETFRPRELVRTPKGEQVFDMGQEFTGIFTLRVNAPKGQEVRIQTGEILQQGCFYNENLRTAKSEYRYVSNGEEVVLRPHFTYYGYRYVKIEGIEDLKPEDFTGLALYSDIPTRGEMRTGHPLVNQLLSNIRWGLKGNFLDVPTDCPQRDERMGWTGDAQVFSPTATYLQDTYSFYAKYLYDMYQEQLALDGKVPNVVPSCGVEDCACVWGDAACIIPWNLYRFYGDKSILRDQFDSMKAWVDYLEKVDGGNHGWRYVFHFGDWLALDNMNGDPEQVLGATDEEFIANVYYAVSAELTAKAARVLGDAQAEERYGKLAQEQFREVKREYYSPTGRCCVKTQTALLLTLKYNLSENRELTIAQLKRLFEQSDGKLQTGFVGTPLLCNVLSGNGMESLAWKLLLNEEYPGWLREVKLGATTVWERWNSLLDDGTISGISMNSMNHYAYGSIGEWMFRHVAGLEIPESVPGCRHMDLRPSLNWELREQETVYDSPAGEYRSAWKILDASHVEMRVTVPFGCTATLVLPQAERKAYEGIGEMRDGVCCLTPGSYEVRYETVGPLKPSCSIRSTIRELRENRQVWEALNRQFPMEQIPKQYIDMSLLEVAEKFGSIPPEQMERLDALIGSL